MESNLPNLNLYANLESDVILESANVDAATVGMHIDAKTFTLVFNNRSMAGNHSMHGLLL